MDHWTLDQLLDRLRDVLEPGHGVGEPQEGAAKSGAKTWRPILQQIFDLYRGRFLDAHSEAWAYSERKRYQSKLFQLIQHLGRVLEEAGDWDEAIRFYYRGIEIDPLVELPYRQLMLALEHVERFAEAITIYERCALAFDSELDLAPSEEIRAIARRIHSV